MISSSSVCIGNRSDEAFDALRGGKHLPTRLALLPAVLHHVTHLIQSPAGFANSSGDRVEKWTDVPSDGVQDRFHRVGGTGIGLIARRG